MKQNTISESWPTSTPWAAVLANVRPSWIPIIVKNGPVVRGKPKKNPPSLALYLLCSIEIIQTKNGAKNNLSPSSIVIVIQFF